MCSMLSAYVVALSRLLWGTRTLFILPCRDASVLALSSCFQMGRVDFLSFIAL